MGFRFSIVKRVLMFVPTMLGVIFIVYGIMELSPGDPARLILGEGAAEEQLALLRSNLGLDRPFPARFALYLYRLVLRGDFGISFRTRQPVIHDIIRKLPYTLTLAFASVVVSGLAGVSLGVFQAASRRRTVNAFITAAALGFASIPGFLLGMLFILAFSLGLGILPSGGAESWRHYILPVAALSLPASASIQRLTRALMLELLHRDYILTARSKGAGESRVVVVHALKNALPPVITALGMQTGYLLGGAVITETVFAMPGLGTHLVNAIRMKDAPVVLACTVLLSFFFCLVMLISDILCAAIDPRSL